MASNISCEKGEEDLDLCGQQDQRNSSQTITEHSAPKNEYRMDHRNRGFVVIIDNKEFDRKLKLPERRHLDGRNMLSLASVLGFKEKSQRIFLHSPIKAKMMETMKKVAARDHTNNDCFVCVILTHEASDGFLYAKDETVELIDLMEPLKNCQSLAEKPKIFIIQADAHHSSVTYGANLSADVVSGEDSDDGDDASYEVRIPTESDFLIGHSSLPDMGQDDRGSPYVHYLCEVFEEERWQTEDLLSILTEVNRRVYEEWDDDENTPLMPLYKSTLCKKLFFWQ